MPAVRKELARITGRDPSVLANPEEVVAVGAALEVARLDGTIEGVLLIDVAARGLMISRQDQDCERVIAQSSVVPTREHKLLPTRHDDQVRVEFDLWEGESPDPSVNRHLGRYAVVEARPHTGRLPQIRRHMKHLSCPLIGDVRYGKGDHNRLWRERFALHRLALHCTSLSVPHPDGSMLALACPIAEDMDSAIAAARAAFAPAPA